jgi:hypothetical protein
MKATQHPSQRLRSFEPSPVLRTRPGISRQKAAQASDPWFQRDEEKADEVPPALTVRVAAPFPFETEIDEREHVAAGFTAGVIAQASATPDGLNPFAGVMMMVDSAEDPAVTEEGDRAEAESANPAAMEITLDVLVLKSPSPLYTAEKFWFPAASVVEESVATPLAFNASLASWVDPSKNVTLPVGVPAAEELTVAVNVNVGVLELALSPVAVAAFCTDWPMGEDVAALRSVLPL